MFFDLQICARAKSQRISSKNQCFGASFRAWPSSSIALVELGKDIEQRGLTEQMSAHTKQVEAEWNDDPYEAYAWLMERLYGRRE